jgi:hypothetical protein
MIKNALTSKSCLKTELSDDIAEGTKIQSYGNVQIYCTVASIPMLESSQPTVLTISFRVSLTQSLVAQRIMFFSVTLPIIFVLLKVDCYIANGMAKCHYHHYR